MVFGNHLRVVRRRKSLVDIFILKELKNHGHNLLKDLLLLLRLKQLVEKMLVDGLLLLLLRVQVSQFVLEPAESVHHYLQGLAQLGGLIAHHLHAVLGGVASDRHLLLLNVVQLPALEVWRLLGVLLDG